MSGQHSPASLHTTNSNPDTADASDHVGAANAIAAGLVAGHTKEKPGYWLHTGGTGILTFEDSDKNKYGNKSDKVYDDWEKVDELLTLPDHAFHRNVDQIVLEAGTKHADVLRTALLCPPTIYGKSPTQPPNTTTKPLTRTHQVEAADPAPSEAAKSTNSPT